MIHSMFALETAISQWIRIVGIGIDVFGVLVIVIGVGWSTFMYISPLHAGQRYEEYKVRIGRTLLLGLEVLVAADIVKTIAIEATLMSLAVLAGLVLVRTFLSWTLVLEIEGCWPWQREPSRARTIEFRSGAPGRTGVSDKIQGVAS